MTVGAFGRIALAPAHLAALATGAKSFRRNPILGSQALNRRGLHVARLKAAERMAAFRRRRLLGLLTAEQREAFEDQGYVVVENAMPAADFDALLAEVSDRKFPARETRQANVATRYITLSPRVLAATPRLRAFVHGPLLQGLMRYVGAANARPVVRLQTVMTDPRIGRVNDVTTMHSDTFQPTSKGWFFLHDVAPEDGPFAYVPGSHRNTPARLEWEYEQSLTAATATNGIHANGSFRVSDSDLAAMGYAPPVDFAVKANTLVVADTHGFHARRPSARPSTRLAVYATLRANPFWPLAGVDPFDLPGLRDRKGEFIERALWASSRLAGKRIKQPNVGALRPTDPPVN